MAGYLSTVLLKTVQVFAVWKLIGFIPEVSSQTSHIETVTVGGDAILECRLSGSFINPGWDDPNTTIAYTSGVNFNPMYDVVQENRMQWDTNDKDLKILSVNYTDANFYRCDVTGVGNHIVQLIVVDVTTTSTVPVTTTPGHNGTNGTVTPTPGPNDTTEITTKTATYIGIGIGIAAGGGIIIIIIVIVVLRKRTDKYKKNDNTSNHAGKTNEAYQADNNRDRNKSVGPETSRVINGNELGGRKEPSLSNNKGSTTRYTHV